MPRWAAAAAAAATGHGIGGVMLTSRFLSVAAAVAGGGQLHRSRGF